MCGIAGYIKRERNRAIPNIKDVMTDMVYFNRPRGCDALGIFKVSRFNAGDKTDQIASVKDVGDPYGLVTQKKFNEMFDFPGDVRYFVMHNRLATKGEKNQVCAQPFLAEKPGDRGNIHLVHNGTIGHIKGEQEFPGRTDSHQIAKMIASGMTLQELESRLWGSFSLVWYDEEDETLNFFRNADRPMGFVHTPEAIFFGSEPYLVAGAVHRRGAGNIDTIAYTKPHDHWKYHYEDKKFESKVVPQAKKEYSSYLNDDSGPPWGNQVGGTNIEDCYPTVRKPEHTVPRGPSQSSPIVKPFDQQWKESHGFATPGQRAAAKLPDYGAQSGASGGRPRTEKWLSVQEGRGFSKGDTLTFSLVSGVPTKRGNQLKISGMAVTFGDSMGPGSLTMIPNMYIYGMLGTSQESVRGKCVLYSGLITELKKKKGGEEYKIMLSSIKETVHFDIFRAVHRTNNRLLIGEPTNPIKPVSLDRKQEEREFADSPETKAKGWLKSLVESNKQPFICDVCTGTFAPSCMQGHKKIFEHDDVTVVVRACPNCNNSFVRDHTILEQLFDKKRNIQLVPSTQASESKIIH